MKEGAEFPPVTVFHDGKEYWLSDGFHRVYAATNARFAEIDADVRKGTVRDAKLFSMSANARHGKRRTNADKRHAVLMALEDEQWRDLSNIKIAEMCEVTEFLVRKIRDEQAARNSIKSNPDQHAPNLNQDELLTLKIRAEEAEKRAEALSKEVDAKIKANADAVKEEYTRRVDEAVAKMKAEIKPAEIDPAEIDRMVGQRVTEKVAELERARREADAERVNFAREHKEKLAEMEERYVSLEKLKNEEISRKVMELDDAAKAGLDLKKLKDELNGLMIDKAQLDTAIEQERESLDVRAKIKKILSAVIPAMTLTTLVNKTVAESPNLCGLTIEDMEGYMSEIKEVVLYSEATLKTFSELIEKIRQGGGLRIV
jgi:hypothetical protein